MYDVSQYEILRILQPTYFRKAVTGTVARMGDVSNRAEQVFIHANYPCGVPQFGGGRANSRTFRYLIFLIIFILISCNLMKVQKL